MFKKQAFSLIELSISMAILAILASSILPIAIRSFQTKAAEKTALEILMIEDASRNYFLDHNSWPADIPTLQAQGYLNPKWTASNPWQSSYQISSNNLGLNVNTDVPIQWTKMIASRLTGVVINKTNVSSTITSLNTSVIASGVIVTWAGSIANIPKGWILCDGSHGTPDLRDKFIVGASQDVGNVAETNIMGSFMQMGGSVNHNHSGQTGLHALTIGEMPAHHHTAPLTDGTPGFLSAGGQQQLKSDTHPSTTSDTGGNQGHNHSITLDYNVPPFYALAYIMKL